MKKGKVVQNTIMLYIMNIAQLVLPLITLPYLTRVLSVSNYGVVNYVKSIMFYMQIIVEFGFLLSATKDIVKAKNNKEIGWIVGNVTIAKLILSCFSFVALLLFSIFIPILRDNLLFTFLSFIPVFLTIFLFDYLFRGIEEMQVITTRYLIMKSISTVLTFFVVKGDSTMLYIPILDTLGSLVAVFFVIKEFKKYNIHISWGKFSDIWQTLNSSFLYFVSSMASTAFGAFNTLLVGILLSPRDVAFWSLVMQMIGAVQALYTPINNGIYPEMVRSKDFRMIEKVMLIFMPIVTLGCLFTYFFAPLILIIIGGKKYLAMTFLVRDIIPLLFISFPSMLFGWPVLGAIEKIKETTFTTVLTSIVQILGLFGLILIHKFSLTSIALLRDFTEAILLLSRLYFCYKFRYCFINKRRKSND
ncbi:oligosaccharide flippase family protein [Limosilactobacillus reuteri]|uniref:Membrane protein involved in the export of O-antigen, teichoic acid lipoteichoic acids n=1 Tax=Limosilactobacillus reuteri TaxID=1598 RepID=A0A0U5JQJ4_LIMRT|nr:Membrane protein involved in the export of O-antigen, teichoic acid lipoteichoic acids [Limosilactobacillus reuteri subsp. porcinus]